MTFSGLDERRTGVLVAVSSLRSGSSRGVGEFADLEAVADWCSNRRISVVQILPVNDSGIQTSPYSAMSAFALHPVYLSIESLPEYPASGLESVRRIPITAELTDPVSFSDTVRAKEAALYEIYDANRDAIAKNRDLKRWIQVNPWVSTYSVFRALRLEHGGRTSMEWPEEHRSGTSDLIEELWKGRTVLTHEPAFFAWIQYHLERQLTKPAATSNRRGSISRATSLS